MSAKPPAKTPNPAQNPPPNFYIELRKYRRALEWAPGNRTQYASAKAYFALIQRDYAKAQRLTDKLAGAGRPKEARCILNRAIRVIEKRRRICQHNARRLIAAKTPELQHPHVASTLAAMMLHGWQTGYCCAGQQAIGAAALISRQTANQIIKLLREAGIIERVGYDWRGEYHDPAGRRGHKWCHVYTVPLVGIASRQTAARHQPKGIAKPPPRPKQRQLRDCVRQPRPRRPKPTKATARPPPGSPSYAMWLCPKPGEWHFDSIAEAESERERNRELQSVGFRAYWPPADPLAR